jgi:hypothetical protein
MKIISRIVATLAIASLTCGCVTDMVAVGGMVFFGVDARAAAKAEPKTGSQRVFTDMSYGQLSSADLMYYTWHGSDEPGVEMVFAPAGDFRMLVGWETRKQGSKFYHCPLLGFGIRNGDVMVGGFRGSARHVRSLVGWEIGRQQNESLQLYGRLLVGAGSFTDFPTEAGLGDDWDSAADSSHLEVGARYHITSWFSASASVSWDTLAVSRDLVRDDTRPGGALNSVSSFGGHIGLQVGKEF